MSTTRKVAHNTFVQIANKFVTTVLGVIAIAMMTRYLGQEQFGWYITAVAFLQFIAIIIDFGLTPVTAQMLSEPDIDNNRLLKNLLGFRITTAVVFLGIAPLLVLFFPYPVIIKQAVAVLALSFFFTAINQIFVGFYQFHLKTHIQAIAESAGRVVFVGALWAVIALGLPFLPVMGTITLASLVYTGLMIFGARKLGTLGVSFEWDVWKKIFSKSWPIAISIMFNVIYLKGDVLLLSLYRNQTEVGIYGSAYRVIDILTQTAMLLMGLLLPLLAFAWARNQSKKFQDHYALAVQIMSFFAIPVVIGIFMLAEPIMVFVAGTDFTSAGLPLRILAIAVAAVYVGAIFGHLAVAIDKQKKTVWIYLTSAILTLIGYLYFIPRFGMLGAAWMSVFAEIFTGLLLFIVVKRYCQCHAPYSSMAKMFFAGLLMAIGIVATTGLHVLAQIFIAAVIYLASVYYTKAVSPATLQEVFGRRK